MFCPKCDIDMFVDHMEDDHPVYVCPNCEMTLKEAAE